MGGQTARDDLSTLLDVGQNAICISNDGIRATLGHEDSLHVIAGFTTGFALHVGLDEWAPNEVAHRLIVDALSTQTHATSQSTATPIHATHSSWAGTTTSTAVVVVLLEILAESITVSKTGLFTAITLGFTSIIVGPVETTVVVVVDEVSAKG